MAAAPRRSWSSFPALTAAVISACAAFAGEDASPRGPGITSITGLSVDGTPIVMRAGRAIHLPARQEADVSLSFEPFDLASAGPSGTRLLFKLEGVDTDWRDIDSGSAHMRMSVIFFSAKSAQTGMFEFFMKGKSAGWRGMLSASQFTRRTSRVTVPPDSAKMGIAIWSGGVFTTVGVLAIDGVTVTTLGKTSDVAPLVTTFSVAATGLPWEKFGSNSDSAVIGDFNGQPALQFIDADPEGFSGWRLLSRAQMAVTPGDTLELEWGEVFSIGANSGGTERYRHLKPGTYRFRLAAATTEGVPTGVEKVTEIVLPEPLWNRPWFWAACGLATGGVLFGTWRYFEWNRLQLELARLEKAHAVSTERTRIAQDLHDELGGSLTQIALASELARDGLADREAARSQLDTIFSTAHHLARQLDAAVWAISPGQDSVESLATFLSKESQEYLRSAGIGCRLQIPDEMPTGQLSSIERRGIFLTIKEALHNVVQHARATEVWIRMQSADGSLTIEVEDDGCGIPADALAGRLPPGHDGMGNMRARIAALGGIYTIAAGAGGRGTIVRFCVPLKPGQPQGHGT